jgi:nitrite reductase/ring-hydroxylating ferredoxin subunit
VIVVSGEQRRIAVFADGERVFAVENNCPHMGFPLDRGSVQNGILTCHWHQARFDLASGCTFDLWADDVPRYTATIEDEIVFVETSPAVVMDRAWHVRRLRRAMEQNVQLVQAKCLLALLASGDGIDPILREAVAFASHHLNSTAEGITRLGCIANLFSDLSAETAYLGLYYAVRRIAEEASGSVARRERQVLDGDHSIDELLPWLVQWTMTRHRDGAERTLMTAAAQLDDRALAQLLFAAASARLYGDGGHLLEDCNKAFEFSERLGRADAVPLFALVAPGLVAARGAEESTHWHHPVELVEPIRALEVELVSLLAAPRLPHWEPSPEFSAALLADDPLAIIAGLRAVFAAGAPAPLVARQVSYAAAMRLARFATSNEVTDWFNPQHTFIFTHAAYRAVARSDAADVVRAVIHGAVAVYHDRFLNVPPARLPEERRRVAPQTADPETLRQTLLELLNRRGDIDDAADVVNDWFDVGASFSKLVDTLTFATVREDLDFHSLQVLSAAVQQARAWGEVTPQARHIMIGAVRNLAAHCPTRRAGQQTTEIAARLHRGERIYEG